MQISLLSGRVTDRILGKTSLFISNRNNFMELIPSLFFTLCNDLRFVSCDLRVEFRLYGLEFNIRIRNKQIKTDIFRQKSSFISFLQQTVHFIT